jgi:hypothetical protein
MPKLLHRSEEFEIHETENQTFRHGLACADRVAKSNALIGLRFEGPSAACRPLRARIRFQETSGPGGSTVRLGEPNRKPGAGSGAIHRNEQLERGNQGFEKLYIVWE